MSDRPSVAAALQRRHLFFFLIEVYKTLHPGQRGLRTVWYLLAMCHALERAAAGKDRRLVISVPPRHLKSITAAVALVAWKLGQDPTLKIMVATYSEKLAREHASACRRIMEQDWYKRLFPKTGSSSGAIVSWSSRPPPAAAGRRCRSPARSPGSVPTSSSSTTA